ncbi:MAG: LysR family transcriptional regulator [Anaerolineales bacterium]|nr:LysR family transcriptional regulator [Anaerolineales bacterium]
MDIDRLKVFLDAAQTLSFSETAQHFQVSQPTVSKHIQDLERTLETRLFERSGSGLRLTESGQAILPWAQHLLQEYRKFQDLAKSLDGDVSGRLRIACTTATGKYILPQLAARFRRRCPNVHISILACTHGDALERLLEDEADLGVVSSEVISDRLDCQYFFTDRVMLIAPADHPWAEKQSIEPADLLGEPLILREPTSGTRRALLSELAAHDISLNDLNIFLEVGNAEAIVALVGSGIGVSFVSRMSAAYAMAFECVAEVPVRGIDLRRKICMARLVSAAPNRARDVFWGFIRDPSNEDLYRLASL